MTVERTLEQMEQQSETTETILVVSSDEEDYVSLCETLGRTVCRASTCQEALSSLVTKRSQELRVVICERDLPDGNWKDVLRALERLACPPHLIVTSRLADEYLWLEVLNLGGWDVLAQPFNTKELAWAVDSAWRRTDPQTETRRIRSANA